MPRVVRELKVKAVGAPRLGGIPGIVSKSGLAGSAVVDTAAGSTGRATAVPAVDAASLDVTGVPDCASAELAVSHAKNACAVSPRNFRPAQASTRYESLELVNDCETEQEWNCGESQG